MQLHVVHQLLHSFMVEVKVSCSVLQQVELLKKAQEEALRLEQLNSEAMQVCLGVLCVIWCIHCRL